MLCMLDMNSIYGAGLIFQQHLHTRCARIKSGSGFAASVSTPALAVGAGAGAGAGEQNNTYRPDEMSPRILKPIISTHP